MLGVFGKICATKGEYLSAYLHCGAMCLMLFVCVAMTGVAVLCAGFF